MHDWYTKAGQGVGVDYRYLVGPGSEGNVRGYRLVQKETLLESTGGTGSILPAETSYELRGGLAQMLPGGFRARLHLDYFSSLTSQQLYNTNIYEASRRQRSVAGSVTGTWGGISLTGNYQRAELFQSETQSDVNGFAPSLIANLSSKRLGTLPFYVSTTADASRILYIRKSDGTEQDFSIGRFDFQPTFRAALSNWSFLNVNASVAFRNTYFSESLDDSLRQVAVPMTRRYLDFRAEAIGPVFSRVYSPNNAIADRLKHVVEPTFSIQRVTDFDNQNRVPEIGGSYDYVVGGVSRFAYGLTNRLLVRKAAADSVARPSAAAPREMLSVSLTQSYYTDALASQFDVNYQSSYRNQRSASNFSPVAVTVRATPTAFTNATVRMEFDQEDGTLRTFNTTGGSTYRAAQVNVGWSTRNYDNSPFENAVNASTTLNFLGGKTGGSYLLNWDVSRGYIIQQRWVGHYHAQCCGLSVEYQQFKFPTSFSAIPQDRRFNLSFTLAGIGTFSNFFGAFGGGQY